MRMRTIASNVIGSLAMACALLAADSPTQPSTTPSETACNSNVVICFLPSAFPKMPEAIASYLTKNHYVIPEPYPYGGPLYNVVSGDIFGTGATDWVINAVKNNRQYLLIFPGGSLNEIEISGGDCLAVGADGLETAVGLATREYILQHAEWYDSSPPFEITHDGINMITLEKASVVRYYRDGKWYSLQGAD